MPQRALPLDGPGGGRETQGMTDTLARLEQVIRDRRGADPATSYVAKLFAKGRPKIAQKLGEEAVETIIAALSGDGAHTTSEAADLVFHLLVLLADMGLSLDDVAAELARREGLSGIAEKAARKE
jgi:phosphoribosyl-ATP pyrophosphohydrolase